MADEDEAPLERSSSPPASSRIPPVLRKKPSNKHDDDPDVKAQPTPPRPRNGFADTDWFSPVEAGAATSTAILDADFCARRAEFPDFHELPDADGSAYCGTLAITDHEVRVALGPQADELMAAAGIDVDELIRLINAKTTVIPVIPNDPSSV